MNFVDWLREQGCQVEMMQPDDGSGYFVIVVTMPDGGTADVTVMVTE